MSSVNYPSTSDFYTLSLHDALPISFRISRATWSFGPWPGDGELSPVRLRCSCFRAWRMSWSSRFRRSEEHTSELQSLRHLVCRLLLEKKKQQRLQTETQRPSVVELT